MFLKNLLDDIEYTILKGSIEKNISSIEYDSREVKKGSLFVCIKGFVSDGHKYIKNAIEKGASAVLVQDDINLDEDITVVKTKDTRKALAILGINFYNNPASELDIYGVTGTNGKTTTTFLISQILEDAGKTTGIIGTIHNKVADKILESKRTTPESLDLQKLFRTMCDNKVDSVVMEVSSHSLDLFRDFGIKYKVAIFTNLSQEHLDFHHDMESYKIAKSKLFKKSEFAVINKDDKVSDFMIKESTGKVYTYGIKNDCDFKAYDVKITVDGVRYKVLIDEKEHEFFFSTPGEFSVYNSLATIASMYIMGIDIELIKKSLSKIEGVRGRFEKYELPNGATAIIDYSHTPDSLLNALLTIREFSKGKVFSVFGCGGDRDKSKRPVMGQIAAENSDFCFVTSDNPRTENPELIVDDVIAGVKKTDTPFEKVVDRKKAIHKALDMANDKDIILIAGKGHETTQTIGTTEYHFDDLEIVKLYTEE